MRQKLFITILLLTLFVLISSIMVTDDKPNKQSELVEIQNTVPYPHANNSSKEPDLLNEGENWGVLGYANGE